MGCPKISVLMSVYNGEVFLRPAIESILQQSFADFEFLIVNDASSDHSREIILSYRDSRIRLIDNLQNIGLTRSLNKGLALARGDYIARMDADDISLPERLEEELKLFSGNVGLVSCWGRRIDEDGNRVSVRWIDEVIRIPDKDIKKRMFTKGNCILGPAAIFSRKVVEKIGFYDETLRQAQDYNYWLRALQYFDVSIVNKDLFLHRKHPEAVSSNIEYGQTDWLKVCKERAENFPVIKLSEKH